MGGGRRWDAQAIYRSRRAAGAVYDLAVCDELTRRLGVEWVLSSRGDGEIAGIPGMCWRCSRSGAAKIDAELDRHGESGPASADRAALVTRTGKNTLAGETLDARWHAEAATVGCG
jgi:hypothetical protein